MRTNEHGSARWMSNGEAYRTGLCEEGGISLGVIQHGEWHTLRYRGEQHLVTIAPNRTGKGVSAIIPNLLDYAGGVFVIDPKGENAIVTADVRRQMLNNVQILDPWGIAVPRLNEECDLERPQRDAIISRTDFDRAAFNPLDMLKPDSPDLTDDAMMIADALIVSEGGEYSHWSTEAKAALQGFILHVVTSPAEDGQRHLPRVRDILSLPPAELQALIVAMSKSECLPVRGAANRLMQKSEKELQSVMSTAGANTHFLDSPALRESLTHSTFDFADLKTDPQDGDPLSVYLVLPADRLTTHGRWLRLLVSMGLTAVSRRKGKPNKSALFILDEFAALGRLKMVEDAFGLMAGFGMRIWAILQDLNQLQDLYPKRWQTFLANAGAVQVFGANDMQTARYFSDLMGKQTVETVSELTHKKRTEWTDDMTKPLNWLGRRPQEPPNPNYRGMNDRVFARELMAPDELMKLDNHTAIVMLSGRYPISVGKLPYFMNMRYFGYDLDAAGFGFFPNYTEHPDQAKFDPENEAMVDNLRNADDWTREWMDEKIPTWRGQPARKRWFGIF